MQDSVHFVLREGIMNSSADDRSALSVTGCCGNLWLDLLRRIISATSGSTSKVLRYTYPPEIARLYIYINTLLALI